MLPVAFILSTPVPPLSSISRSSFNSKCPINRNNLQSCPSMTAAKIPSKSSIPIPSQSTDVTASSLTKLDRVVCKFGGSSLADADRLREVTKLVKLQKDLSNKPPIIVLSAMGSSTNELLSAGNRALYEGVVDASSVRARAYNACQALGLDPLLLVDPILRNLEELLVGIKFIKELSPRTKDVLVSFGERLSVRIFAAHLQENESIPARHVDAFDAGFVTNSEFTFANVKETQTFERLRAFFGDLPKDEVIVITGFIAKDEEGNITTLGRGGSDLTASILGAALKTSEVQVWKDVDGILTTDPRIVQDARPIPNISFEEATEMAFFGAKVLHPIAMLPAMKANIPVRVKNSYNPQHPGTVITSTRAFNHENPVTAISIKKNVQVVDVVSTRMLGAYGFLAEVFKTFARYKVSVDMIATSEVSISMTLDNAMCKGNVMTKLKEELQTIAKVSISEDDKAIVSLVSDASQSGKVVGKAVSTLDHAGIEVLMISQGASKFNISFTIPGEKAALAAAELHKAFFH